MQARQIPADAPADRVLVLTRELRAPRSLVYAAWTEPDHLMRWWGPHGFRVVSCELDPREGGAWRVTMRSPEGNDHTSRGRYHALTPPERLVFSFAWEGQEDGEPGHETLVEIDLEEVEDKTRMVFRQAVFTSTEARDSHEGGWSESFERLSAYVAGR